MADFRAIGGVSQTLQTLLVDRMDVPDGGQGFRVTVGSPKVSKADEETKDDPRVNLFLYRVTQNGYLANQEIPGHGSPGAYGHPPLSLALHYLLTAYGSETVPGTGGGGVPPLLDEKLAHELLGSAMRVLHDVPVVTEGLTTVSPPSGRLILAETLRDEFEQVKLTLDPLSLEDVTKVWTALTLRYRVSAAYVVNVIQIESRRRRSFPQRVGKPTSPHGPPPGAPPEPGPHVVVFPFRSAHIAQVRVRRAGQTEEQPFPYASVGDVLVLLGSGLGGETTEVLLGDLRVPPLSIFDGRIEVELPDASLPAGPIPAERRLMPGVRTIGVTLGDPFQPGRAVRSNDAVFMLVPRVSAPPTLVAGPPRVVRIVGSRLFAERAPGETVIGSIAVPSTEYAAATDTQIDVPLSDGLPQRGVRVVVGDPLPATVTMGPAAQEIQVTIGARTEIVRPAIPASVARERIPALLEAAVRDAAPDDAGFRGTRVALVGDRLLILPGRSLPIAVAAGAGTAAADLGLTAAQPPGADHVTLSGSLAPFPAITAPNARLTVAIGTAPREITFVRPTSLAEAVTLLAAAVTGAGTTAAYTGTRVAVVGTQLAIVPGASQDVVFGPAPGDVNSTAELALAGRYAVRVRVNGAESIDDVGVDLP